MEFHSSNGRLLAGCLEEQFGAATYRKYWTEMRQVPKAATLDPRTITCEEQGTTSDLGASIAMRYSYSAAWSVIGGISLPADSQPIELYRSQSCRFVLTRDPDSFLANSERGAALGRLMLKGLFAQPRMTECPVALETEIEEIKAERKKKAGPFPVLVLEARGEIDATINNPVQQFEDCVVTFDAVDKEAVRRAHQSEIEAMKLAVACESQVPSRFAALSEGTYLADETGKIIYSINISGSAEGSISTNLSTEGPARISARYSRIRQANDLNSVLKTLLANDPLWTRPP